MSPGAPLRYGSIASGVSSPSHRHITAALVASITDPPPTATSRSARAARAELAADSGVMERVARSAGHVDAILQREGVIYGVTTGYGDSCTTDVPPSPTTNSVLVSQS